MRDMSEHLGKGQVEVSFKIPILGLSRTVRRIQSGANIYDLALSF